MKMKRNTSAVLVTLALAVALSTGCESHSKPISTLSEAQRDTVLSRSDIPGARAVGRAFEVAGKEAEHSAQLDSLAPQH